MDINANVLRSAAATNPHYETWKGDLLLKSEYPTKNFDSIACFNVMHCVPGGSKWEHMMYNTAQHINDGGVLFGASVLNTHPLSKALNAVGVFHNTYDTEEHMKRVAKLYYETISVEKVGHVVLFAFKRVKT